MTDSKSFKWFAKIWWELPDGTKGVYTETKVPSLWENDCGEPEWFMWDLGNYSCDCNRSIFFLDLGQGDEDAEWPCGDTIKILNREAIPVEGADRL